MYRHHTEQVPIWDKGSFFLPVIAAVKSLNNDVLSGIGGADTDTCGPFQLNGVGPA